MKKFGRVMQGLAVVVGLLVLATSGQAAVFTGTQGDGSYSVTTGTNTITITLTDIAVNPTDVLQNVSGFVFSTSSGSAGSGLVDATGATYVNVGVGGVATTPSVAQAIWGFSGTSTQYVLTWNPGAGGTGPAYTILGAPGAGGVYSNANGSIANNSPHNPFINQVATFTLDIDGITSATTLSGITIMFGTSWSVPPPPSVPEASALTLLSTGLVGLVMWRRKKRFE